MLSAAYRYVRSHQWQLFRFGIVGAATFSLNFFLVWLLYGRAGVNYKFAVTGAYVITVMVHFALNRSFTYRQSGGSAVPDTAKYGMMLLVNYLATLSISTLTVEFLLLTPYYGIVFSTFVTAFTSFILMKHFVFTKKEHGI